MKWLALLVSAFVADLPSLGAETSCDPIVTFADKKVPAQEIFVSPNGNNFKGDGSRGAPFQTIARAFQDVKPGTTVRLLPGEYSGGAYIAKVAGTAEAPIWFGGAPGAPKPVFSGGASAILISRARYLVVENLVVTGAKGNGVNCDDGGEFANPEAARHVVFRNLEIRDIGTNGNQDGLKLSGLNDFFVVDCAFKNISANGSGIDQVGCHRGTIARCVFTGGGNSIQAKGGSEEIEIRGNRFDGVMGRGINIGGSTGLSLFRPPLSKSEPNFEARKIRVGANVFKDCEAPVAFVNATECIAANNTIVNPKRFVARILQETLSKDGFVFPPCGKNEFINNLIVYEAGRIGMHVNDGANTGPASFIFANNLWFAHDRPERSRPKLPAAETGGIYGVDPGLKNLAEGDYSLEATSIAIGKGRELAWLKADFQERCFRERRSIGAFEGAARK